MAVRRRESHRLVTGDKELDEVLKRLKTGAANRIVRPAVRKAARRLLKSTKANVPSKYRKQRGAFGYRVDNKGGPTRKDPQAKVGAAVGKAAKHHPIRTGRRTAGITGRNIHWLILGTKDRYHWRTTNKWVGKMPAILLNLIPNTLSQEQSKLTEIIRKDVMQRIEDMVKNGKINRQFETT